ncbi:MULTISPECIES: chaperone NapD [Cohaesibacter]|uniref:chaperone NapD n=1 Tax=Cohaesibacter TaxID=655352 RepID=UPI000DE9F7A3|nr:MULTISPECIES: chaperone NapD [Cohaesibacter]TLP48104.1 nitrate reductase [Cohaesibacter sp. CAU 1516]
MFNICGCLVHVMPAEADRVIGAIEAMAGCEVHAHEDGRLVVTVEDIGDQKASDTIMAMHQIPGVLTITLTYHHFEPLGPQEAAASAL